MLTTALRSKESVTETVEVHFKAKHTGLRKYLFLSVGPAALMLRE